MHHPIALIIIDMQRGIQQLPERSRNNPQAAERIAVLLAAWRSAGWPVVHIRHISREAGSVFAPGQPGVEFHPPLAPLPHEALFEKNTTDAFLHSGLERWLQVRGIESVALVGVASENSVENSARTAGNLGFRTLVAEDACFTYAKADFAGTPRSADEVHAMAMANLHGEYARVLDSDTLLGMLPQ